MESIHGTVLIDGCSIIVVDCSIRVVKINFSTFPLFIFSCMELHLYYVASSIFLTKIGGSYQYC